MIPPYASHVTPTAIGGALRTRVDTRSPWFWDGPASACLCLLLLELLRCLFAALCALSHFPSETVDLWRGVMPGHPPAHSARGHSGVRPSLPVPWAAHRPDGTTAPSQPFSNCHVPTRCSLPLGLHTRCQACMAPFVTEIPSPHPSLRPPAGVSVVVPHPSSYH